MSNRKRIKCSDDIVFLLSDKQIKVEELSKDELIIIQDVVSNLLSNSTSTGTKENEIIYDANDIAEKLYKLYPRKAGKARGIQLVLAYLKNGRVITGQGKVKYNHIQIDLAIQAYTKKVQGYEEQYIKVFSTFMNLAICDYIEITKDSYEKYMQKKYGDNWKKIKFIYK